MTTHRIIFIKSDAPSPIDLVRSALDTPTADTLTRAHRALARLTQCLAELVSACELAASDTEKIARVEAALIRLHM